jgi:hypothetical protein
MTYPLSRSDRRSRESCGAAATVVAGQKDEEKDDAVAGIQWHCTGCLIDVAASGQLTLSVIGLIDNSAASQKSATTR